MSSTFERTAPRQSTRNLQVWTGTLEDLKRRMLARQRLDPKIVQIYSVNKAEDVFIWSSTTIDDKITKALNLKLVESFALQPKLNSNIADKGPTMECPLSTNALI